MRYFWMICDYDFRKSIIVWYYPGRPRTPIPRDKGKPSKSRRSMVVGSEPSVIVWVLHPNSPTTYFPIGNLGFLLSDILLNLSLKLFG